MEGYWADVQEAVRNATAITWDTCHKVYVLMDEASRDEMIGYDYDPMVEVGDDHEGAMNLLRLWWEESCPLRFIDRIEGGVTNAGITTLIPQGADEEDDEREDDWL